MGCWKLPNDRPSPRSTKDPEWEPVPSPLKEEVQPEDVVEPPVVQEMPYWLWPEEENHMHVGGGEYGGYALVEYGQYEGGPYGGYGYAQGQQYAPYSGEEWYGGGYDGYGYVDGYAQADINPYASGYYGPEAGINHEAYLPADQGNMSLGMYESSGDVDVPGGLNPEASEFEPSIKLDYVDVKEFVPGAAEQGEVVFVPIEKAIPEIEARPNPIIFLLIFVANMPD